MLQRRKKCHDGGRTGRRDGAAAYNGAVASCERARHECGRPLRSPTKERIHDPIHRYHLRAGRLPARGRWPAPGAHLPVHHLEVRHVRAHGAPVRPGGGRLLLHPPAEPHQRCRGGQDRRARGRYGGHADLVGPGCQLLRGVQYRRLRRPCGRELRHLRRHVQPASAHDGPHGARVHVRRSALHRRGARGGVPPQHQVRLRRDDRQPGAVGARHRALRQGRACTRRAADRGQHVPDARHVPPDRVGRRHRDALDHQVHRRPRRDGGRRDRGFRQVRLDGACRQVPRADHAGRELPWRHLRREVRP